MARRRSDKGCVDAVPGMKDTWRIRWYEDTSEGRKRKSHRYHGKYAGAVQWLRNKLDDVGESGDGKASRPTFGKMYDKWHEGKFEKLSPCTQKEYLAAWKRLEPRWSKTPCESFIPKDFEDWVLDERNGMSCSTAHICRALMSNLLTTARMYGHIQHNPLYGLRIEKPAVKKPRPSVTYDAAELSSICNAFRGSPVEASIILMAQGGMRVGESLGVKPEDIAVMPAIAPGGSATRVAHVSVRMTCGETSGKETDRLKTKASYGVAFVTEPWASRLEALAVEAKERGQVFLTENGAGSSLGKAVLRNIYKETLSNAGIPVGNPKDLRTSFEATRVYDSNLSIEQVAKLMRHASPSTTAMHYNKPTEKQLANVAAIAEAANR